jgi:hypothetical protein
MAFHPPAGITEQMLQRVYSEYLEMPGMRLTRQQAQRLYGLDEHTCTQVLEYLVEAGFLVRAGGDTYRRLTDGAMPVLRLRMAKGQLERSDDRRRRSQVS